MVTDSRQKSFVMAMHLTQCFARAKAFPTEKKTAFVWLFWFFWKVKCVKKARI